MPRSIHNLFRFFPNDAGEVTYARTARTFNTLAFVFGSLLFLEGCLTLNRQHQVGGGGIMFLTLLRQMHVMHYAAVKANIDDANHDARHSRRKASK